MTSPFEFRLLLGDEAVVSAYDTREEAEAARDWYVQTYGPPSMPLTVEEVAVDA